ncbi:MAG: hypothetical protein U0798_13015 [Gemmataceae bacterium]
MTHFPVERFIAKGGGTPGRFLGLLIGAIVTGAVLDFGLSYVAEYCIPFFLFFPFMFGLVYGKIVGMIGRAIRARSGRGSQAVTCIAIVCGMFTYAGFHLGYHLNGNDPDRKPGESFFESLNRRATKGYILHGKRGGKTNFGYTGTWIYWAVEMGIVTVTSLMMIQTQTKGPYCEVCDRWNRRRRFGPFAFNAVVGHEAFINGEPTAMFTPGPKDHKVKIEVFDCPTCPDDPLAIHYIGTVGSGKTMVTHSAFMVYPHEALPAFEAIEIIANGMKG